MSWFTVDEMMAAGDAIGVNWNRVSFNEFSMGMKEELEHSDITGGDPILTAKITMAHLKELPDYYTRLRAMERQAKKERRRGLF